MKPFYITTAIDYANGSPHLGHAYEKVITDVIARFRRLMGDDYNDEIESQKIANKAGLRFVWDTATDTVKAYNAAGTELNIQPLEDELWTYKEDAMHDRRRERTDQEAHVTLVDIDVGKLKQLIENPDTSKSKDHIAGFDPSTDWNGVVYFECSSGSGDPKLNRTGIRLYNGATGHPNKGIPSRGTDPGMTFATNNVLYIKDHFNADGNLDPEGSAYHSALVPEPGEVPVALMADTVTFLSHTWNDAASKAPGNVNNVQGAYPQGMEVAAAIVSGIVPSDAGGNGTSSGGAHNFPRFLENWGGKDFYIRGSMVCLYEAEVDRSLYSTVYYSPPKRNWGFSNLFKSGTYPPGTPLLRTYRRLDYREMSQAEYQAALSTLPW